MQPLQRVALETQANIQIFQHADDVLIFLETILQSGDQVLMMSTRLDPLFLRKLSKIQPIN